MSQTNAEQAAKSAAAATAGTSPMPDASNTASAIATASAAFQELTKAYQELGAKSASKLKSAIQALSAVKTPAEFIEVQQKLIKEGVEAAVADSQNIAHLTAAVFTAAFEPVKKQIETAQKTALH